MGTTANPGFHEKILKMWELIPDYDFTEKPEMMGTYCKT
ncbi:hypothetical protein LEP1GSC082_4062 [Leptospira kirschneri str. H2]|uniref:Uncharacterized protein n=2 Tax=Leptospira kirschneri TaxID=29507 RepID=A0A0E2B743_9LEPT|nr:hypothetical protein LEP1GSC081_2722 [Leptospira kirschneri str. H1]EKO61586.1 hypothetical protein LEP1GSC082_4062 [Leptospira kirschneri str. H2]EMK22923.1 hypothetical protein LEP1GSC008_3174 [Leptospira kirschneri serovar Bulgarica str. Nikolaevo]